LAVALAVTLVCAFPGALDAQPASPAATDRSAEQRALDFVAALGTGDADAVLDFLRHNLTPAFWEQSGEDDWRTFAGRVLGDLGGAEVMGIDVSGQEVSLDLARRGAPPVRLVLPYDGAQGDRLAGISLEPFADPGGPGGLDLPAVSADPRGDRQRLATALDAFFDRVEEDHGFSGTALVAVDGRPVYSTARGLASRRYGVANTLDTRFDVGSINKSFTRVAIGRLLAAGALALDDTIADHLPDYPEPEVAARVTIAHLLEHRSGLPDFFGPRFQASSKALYTSPSSFFPLFAEEPLQFEPGSQRRYSNSGFLVLGAIIEAVAGQPFAEHVAEHVFAPAGMRGAGFFRQDGVEPRVATGYTALEGGAGVRSVHYVLPAKGSPAGSAFATAADLLAFDSALRDKRLLPAGYTRWYFDGQVGEEPESFRGDNYGGGIAGGAPGVSAVLESDGRLTVIVLSNFDEPLGEQVGLHLSRGLSGQ